MATFRVALSPAASITTSAPRPSRSRPHSRHLRRSPHIHIAVLYRDGIGPTPALPSLPPHHTILKLQHREVRLFRVPEQLPGHRAGCGSLSLQSYTLHYTAQLNTLSPFPDDRVPCADIERELLHSGSWHHLLHSRTPFGKGPDCIVPDGKEGSTDQLLRRSHSPHDPRFSTLSLPFRFPQ